LRTLNNGNEILINGDRTNPGIELRDTTNSARTPYIDFSNDNASDYDFRLILASNDQFWVQGGRTTFSQDDGTPSVIRVGEVWFCSGYN
jgi:hypothetical protein